MTSTADLPQSGETIILPDDTTATVAWCSGWTWPIGEPAPTRLYVQPEVRGKVLGIELRVIAARDALGERFWLAERRTGETHPSRARETTQNTLDPFAGG